MVAVNIRVDKPDGDFSFNPPVEEYKALKIIQDFLIEQFAKREKGRIKIELYH